MNAAVLIAALLTAAAAPTAPTAPAAPPAPAAPAQATPPPARSKALKGSWPAEAPRVHLDFDHVRTREAIKKLAEAAHWGVTFKDKPTGRVDATFSDVRADEALASILQDHDLTAQRSGDLVTIARRPAEDDEEADKAEGEEGPHLKLGNDSDADRTQVGGSVTVAEGETVKSAVAVGGSVRVDGTVLQDAVAVGGSVKLGPKAVVKHDVVSVGGSLDIDPSAKVGGDRVSVGLGGLIVPGHGHAGTGSAHAKDADEPTGVKGFFAHLAKSLAQFALLFVFGLLLLAFVPERVKSVARELRRVPAQCGAIGLVGMVGLVPLTILLVVTVVGILVVPFLYLAVAVAVLLGLTALASEVGARVPPPSAKRTQVLVLALGVAAMFLLGQVPVLGPIALFLSTLVAFGAALRTKLGKGRMDANFAPEP